MRPASSWRRRNDWRKICACCTWPDPRGLALQPRRGAAQQPEIRQQRFPPQRAGATAAGGRSHGRRRAGCAAGGLLSWRYCITETGRTGSHPWQAPAATIPRLSARELQRRIADDWRVTSYSGLQQHGFSGGQDLLPRLDVDAAGVGEVVEEPQLTPHQFPRGAAPGPSCTACLRSWTSPSRCRKGGWRRSCS